MLGARNPSLRIYPGETAWTRASEFGGAFRLGCCIPDELFPALGSLTLMMKVRRVKAEGSKHVGSELDFAL